MNGAGQAEVLIGLGTAWWGLAMASWAVFVLVLFALPVSGLAVVISLPTSKLLLDCLKKGFAADNFLFLLITLTIAPRDGLAKVKPLFSAFAVSSATVVTEVVDGAGSGGRD